MNKFFKILAPIVALGLLIGALVGINVQAAEGGTTTPEIISMNVEYGSELYLYYAVDKASVEGKPSLEVLDAEGNVIDTVTYYTEETVNGVPCYIFRTAGVAPGQLNKAEYVRAAAGDVKGDTVKYSVEDYLYTRLYKNGFVAKTEADGDDYVRRNLYFQLLAYGKSAQTAFYPDAEDKIGNPGIAIKGNAAASGEYAKGDCIVLSAPAIEGFDYWSVTELTPFGEVIGTRKLGAGYEYLAGNSAMIIPVTDDDAAEGVEAWDSSVITCNVENSKLSYYVNKSTVETRVDAETGNKYVYINKAGGTGTTSFYLEPTGGDAATATQAVIKFDMYVLSKTKIDTQYYFWTKASESFKYSPFLGYKASNTMDAGKWYTIEIVYTPISFEKTEANPKGEFIVEVFVNGNVTALETFTTFYGASGTLIPKMDEIRKFVFSFNNNCAGEFIIDNLSFVFK